MALVLTEDEEIIAAFGGVGDAPGEEYQACTESLRKRVNALTHAASDGRLPVELDAYYAPLLTRGKNLEAAREVLATIAEVIRRERGLYDKTLHDLAAHALRIEEDHEFLELVASYMPYEFCVYFGTESYIRSFSPGFGESLVTAFPDASASVLKDIIRRQMQRRGSRKAMYLYLECLAYREPVWSLGEAEFMLKVAAQFPGRQETQEHVHLWLEDRLKEQAGVDRKVAERTAGRVLKAARSGDLQGALAALAPHVSPRMPEGE